MSYPGGAGGSSTAGSGAKLHELPYWTLTAGYTLYMLGNAIGYGVKIETYPGRGVICLILLCYLWITAVKV